MLRRLTLPAALVAIVAAALLAILAAALLAGSSGAAPDPGAASPLTAPAAEREARAAERDARAAERAARTAERRARAQLASLPGEPALGEPPAVEPPGAEPPSAEPPTTEPPARSYPRVRWRRSRSVGLPFDGRLERGVRLPRAGRDFVTWDPIHRSSPNRHWRRWGTARLVRVLLRVAREHRAAHPDAPRLVIGDLSRPRGGDFGARFGGLGHASHQSGLDVDVYYPRLDRRELRPGRVDLVDLELAQDLVDRFVAAGAEYVFVGPSTPLTGPRGRVQPLVHHDDHLHIRLPPARALRARTPTRGGR